MSRRPLLGLVSLALAAAGSAAGPASAQCLDLQNRVECFDSQFSYTGTADFFATGASFAFIDDPNDDRPGGLLTEASVTVPERRIPPRAELVGAFLYFGGSLFMDGDNVESPDDTVEIQFPGSSAFVPVKGLAVFRGQPLVIGQGAQPALLYSVVADITGAMRAIGGPMHGKYTVRGFDADILEGNLRHTIANASFSIVLVFEEPRLSPRSITVFDGLRTVLGSTITLDLTGFTVSQVPSGSLTLYAMEGDCHPGPMSCANGNNEAGAERVRVSGEDAARRLTLRDAVNPPNDIFNRTINTVEPPLRDVPGTDIDTFDITSALRAGDEKVSVEITTPNQSPDGRARGELIGLAYVVVGIDVFAPELRVDSRVEVRTAQGDRAQEFYPGDPLRVAYVVSNTGNIPATGVKLEVDVPANVVAFEVDRSPAGTSLTVDKAGGAFGRGRVVVENLSVRHGDATDLVLLVETECPLPNGGALTVTATIGPAKEGGRAFDISSTVPLLKATRCGPRFFLFGGGGCASAGPVGAGAPLLVLALLALIFRRKLACILLLLVACEQAIEPHADAPPPPVIGVPCPGHEDMVVVPPIGQRAAFCIDRFEAGVTSDGVLGNADQSAAGANGDGSTTAAARAARFARPASGVTFFQARALCANAGKRLCRADEWLTACRGDGDSTYPYGDEYEGGRCNGYLAGRHAPVESGGMFSAERDAMGNAFAGGCVSKHGAYDMSGNLWEWNATSYLEGTRRGLTGGSFRSNATGLRCVTDDNHARPAEVNDAYGFRCCTDFPF